MSESEEIKHYGVPGMKWGKTKGSYNAMSSSEKKSTREEFKAKTNSRIDAARRDIKSGMPKARLNVAKQNRNVAKKTNKGYEAAEKIFQKEKATYLSTVNTANTLKYGKGTVAGLMATGLLAFPSAAIVAGVYSGHKRQKIGTGSGRQS